MASYHAEVRRRQALSREVASTAPPVGLVKFDGDIPRRPRRHTVESIDRETKASTEDGRVIDGGKPSFWKSAAPRLPGGLSLLRRSLASQGSENDKSDAGGNTPEPPMENDRQGKLTPEPPIDYDRRNKISQMGLPSSSRRIKDSRMYLGLQNLRKNSTVSRIRAHASENPDSVQKKSWDEADSLSTVLLKSLSKTCLCDVMIVGRDEANPVGAPSYLLAAHSDVFLGMLYLNSTDAAENVESPSSSRKVKASFAGFLGMLYDSDSADAAESVNSPSSPRKVEIPFARRDAIEGFIHFLATRSFPGGHEDECSEANLRCLCQIHHIGRIYKIASLTNHAYRAACRLMNKFPHLVCAVLDEFIVSAKLLPSNIKQPPSRDELKDFVLEYLKSSPTTTLLGGGTQYLGCEAIEFVLGYDDMGFSETTMFTILNSWVKQNDERIETGKALISNITLAYIKPDYLNNVVRKCSFVDSTAVDNAMRDIDDMLGEDPADKSEHVLVEGAGDDAVNGVYVRMEEDIGLENSVDVMFVKEAREGECISDYGMYRRHSTWAITSCVDHSNILYSCEVPEGDPSALYRAPYLGWMAVGSSYPAPTCTYNPGKHNSKTAAEGFVAPNLVEAKKKSIEDINQGDHDDGCRRYSLETMLMLPSDEGHENNDYHSDFDDSCMSFNLSASSKRLMAKKSKGTRRLRVDDDINDGSCRSLILDESWRS